MKYFYPLFILAVMLHPNYLFCEGLPDQKTPKSVVINNDITDAPKTGKNRMLPDSSSLNVKTQELITEAKKELDLKINKHDQRINGILVGLWTIILATIALFLGALGIIGVGGARLVKKKLRTIIAQKVQLAIDNKALLTQTALANHFGFIQYQDYMDPDGDNKISLLNSAIRQTKWALECCNQINPDELSTDDKDDLISNTNQIKNNLSYYIAIKDKNDYASIADKELAIRISNEACPAKQDACPSIVINNIKEAEWLESHCFVLYQLGDQHQKNKACELFRELITNPYLPRDWRKKLECESDWISR